MTDPTPTPTPDRPPLDLDAIANVAVVRRLLAHAKAEGWKREPLDVTEDGDHGVRYHNYMWRTPDLQRVCVGTAFHDDHTGIPDWFVNTWGGNTNVGIEHVETAQQVADLLAIIDLVPAEVTALRAELDAARAERTERSELDLNAIWQRSEQYQAMWDAVPSPPSEAHAFAAALSADDVRPLWEEVVRLTADPRAERTEPATGEDVEVVARAMYLAWHHGGDSDGGRPWEDQTWDVHREYRRAAPHVLAALDLPGRIEHERKRYELMVRAANTAADERDAAVAEVDNQRAKAIVARSKQMAAEDERDAARLEADTWWKRSELQVDIITELRDEIERLKAVGDEAGRER